MGFKYYSYTEYIYDLAYLIDPEENHDKDIMTALGSVGFKWRNHTDDSRVMDALELRAKVYLGQDPDNIPEIEYGFVSFLEVMIAMIMRIAEGRWVEPEDKMVKIFDKMLDNMGIDKFTTADEIKEICEKINDGEFSADGEGSFFYIPGISSTDVWLPFKRKNEAADFRNLPLTIQMNLFSQHCLDDIDDYDTFDEYYYGW